MSKIAPSQAGGGDTNNPIPVSPSSGGGPTPTPGPGGPTPPGPQATPKIPGITPDPTFGNMSALMGGPSLEDQIHQSGFRVGTPQFDQWILSQPFQAEQMGGDYNAQLTNYQNDARRRQALRAQFPNTTPEEELAIEAGHTPNPRSADGLNPNERKALADANAARAKQTAVANARAANEDATRGKPVQGLPTPTAGGANANAPIIVDSNGNPISGTSAPSNGPASQSGALSGSGNAPKTSGPQVLNGNYVWISSGQSNQTAVWVQDKDGNWVKQTPQGNTVVATDMYMSTDDAKASIYGMSPQQIAGIQKAYHITPTGIVDKKTYDLWTQAVDAAAGYTKAGKHMSPVDVLSVYAQKGGGGSGGGGGGGGGGAAKFKLSDVQALLTTVTQKELGRDPTQSEVNAFYSYFNGLAGGDTADPTQIATDWVRLNNGSEQGAYGAATNYYQAMLAVLGPSAVGGSSG